MKKGEQMTIEQKQKIAQANTGKNPSKEARKRMSDAQKKNPNRYWLGKKRLPISEKHKQKLSFVNKGNQYTKGMKFPNRKKPSFDTEERKRKISEAFKGSKHPLWKGGNRQFYMKQAKIRDNFTCQICGNNDRDVLEVDHIMARKLRPDLDKEMSNLVTLCANCHRKKTKRDMEQIYSLRYSGNSYGTN